MSDADHGDSHVVGKEPCPSCGSSDNLRRYSDGHAYCFTPGCARFEPGDGREASAAPRRKGISMDERMEHEPRDLVKRGIFADTCRKYGYGVGQDSKGRTVQIADYRDLAGVLVAQKVRTADKDFYAVGDLGKTAPLFGMHLFRDKGKRVMVTEGEIDALSLGQVFGLSWPVVSVPKGAAGARAALQHNLEWLEGFDEVVLCFDQDDAGRKAASECAPLFTPGKCKVWTLPLKDANEMLVARRGKELTQAVYDARTFRPGGIKNGSELWEEMRKRITTPGDPFPWAGLTAKTTGQHPGTVITWVSGTGMGKSTAVAWVGYERLMASGTVGHVALEESCGKTAERYVAMHMEQRLDTLAPDQQPREEDIRAAFDATLGTGRLWTYDHFGSTDDEGLISKLRYLIKGCGCTTIILDHISIVVSGMDGEQDERRTIDRLMTSLRSLAEETGATLHVISHLRRPGGDAKSHEEGGRITLAHLRGSQAIAQLSDLVIALERDQQDPKARSTATCRVLKNRATGWTGVACFLRYDDVKGTMTETEDPATAEGFDDETAGGDDDDLPF
jgi:twinkle protein